MNRLRHACAALAAVAILAAVPATAWAVEGEEPVGIDDPVLTPTPANPTPSVEVPTPADPSVDVTASEGSTPATADLGESEDVSPVRPVVPAAAPVAVGTLPFTGMAPGRSTAVIIAAFASILLGGALHAASRRHVSPR